MIKIETFALNQQEKWVHIQYLTPTNINMHYNSISYWVNMKMYILLLLVLSFIQEGTLVFSFSQLSLCMCYIMTFMVIIPELILGNLLVDPSSGSVYAISQISLHNSLQFHASLNNKSFRIGNSVLQILQDKPGNML